MKAFTYNKIGYSFGESGCTAEFFLFTITTNNNIRQFVLSGLYGSEERVKGGLEKLGYELQWCVSAPYGRITRKDLQGRQVFGEYELINHDEKADKIKELIK